MAHAEGVSVQAGARLDRLPTGRFHRRILLMIGAGLFLDAFEVYMAGGVLGALVKSGWSDMRMNAAFVSATMIGMMLGAWLSGFLGDRYGRRFSYQLNLALFGGASLAAAFAPNMPVLIGLRFVMGIGLGAEIVVGYATLHEFVPPRTRGRWLGILSFLTNCSLAVSAFVGLWVIPAFGWRTMFAVVGVAALGVWLLRKSMPESPRWLESKGRLAEADALLRSIEGEAAKPGRDLPPLPPAAPESAPPGNALDSLGALFSPALLRRTLIAISINITMGCVIYGFVVWLPSIFVKEGRSVVSSLHFVAMMSLGAPVGALLGMALADRIGRKAGVGGACLLAALFGSVYPFVGSDAWLMATGFGIVTCIYAFVTLGFAIHVPELFPTSCRLRGAGLTGGIGRLAGAGIQFVVVAVFAQAGIYGVVALLVSILLIQAAIMFGFGIETKHRSLESLAPGAVVPLASGPPSGEAAR